MKLHVSHQRVVTTKSQDVILKYIVQGVISLRMT